MGEIVVKVNCTKNDCGAWCEDKRIKRSLFGIGARCCVLYDNKINKCDYQEKMPRPIIGYLALRMA